jgi:hypothetical protein
MSLTEKLDRVTSLDSFLEFVDALIAERQAKGTVWQNSSIESYLEAATAWARDSRGQDKGVREEATGRTFANFLYCGKIYE